MESIKFTETEIKVKIVDDLVGNMFKLQFVPDKCPEPQNVKFIDVIVLKSSFNCNKPLNNTLITKKGNVDEFLNLKFKKTLKRNLVTDQKNTFKNIINYSFCNETKSSNNLNDTCSYNIINDHLVEKFPIYFTTVLKTASTSSEILRVKATIKSPNSAEMPQIFYSIASSQCFDVEHLTYEETNCIKDSDAKMFRINTQTGQIYVQKSFKYSTQTFYGFDVIAFTENTSKKLISQAKTRVHVFIKVFFLF